MNKITRKSFLKVLAATMVGGAAASALTGAAAPVSIDETNGKVSRWVKNSLNPDGPLTIAKQGMFSSGGTVTAPVAGTYDATTNWLDTTRAGNTAHVDHANVLYQIPADSNGWPMVYLHGYGQSRMGWITTPDGRQGWADLFLRNGYSAFLVDQPRRGEAGSTAQMSTDGFLDTWSADSKDYKPGDQAWYTHFRIGRVAPERYEGSQFPEGDAAQNQFFRQMTPNTGDFDQAVAAAALGEVMKDVQTLTGHNVCYQDRYGRNHQHIANDEAGLMHKLSGGHIPKGGHQPDTGLRNPPDKHASARQYHCRRIQKSPTDNPLHQV